MWRRDHVVKVARDGRVSRGTKRKTLHQQQHEFQREDMRPVKQ